MSANKNINSVQDYDDVLAVVQGYVEGLKTGDVEQLKKTFHKDAIMYGHLPEGLSQGHRARTAAAAARAGAHHGLERGVRAG